jgi:hypothetical protein
MVIQLISVSVYENIYPRCILEIQTKVMTKICHQCNRERKMGKHLTIAPNIFQTECRHNITTSRHLWPPIHETEIRCALWWGVCYASTRWASFVEATRTSSLAWELVRLPLPSTLRGPWKWDEKIIPSELWHGNGVWFRSAERWAGYQLWHYSPRDLRW